ncbi:MAG: winged helix-turn-helix domain-containing protein [Promethearchaeota archaeon]
MKNNGDQSPILIKDDEILFEFWKSVPIVQIIPDPHASLFKFINQDVRGAILDLLREGIEDEIKAGTKRRRFSLNARELQKYVNNRLLTPIKLSNIYFHLQKLEKQNLIQVVAIKKEGKHHAAYYGRTAKFFIFNDTSKEIRTIMRQTLHTLIARINPKWENRRINLLLDNFFNHKENQFKSALAWIEKHEDLLTNLEVDIGEIYFLLEHLGISDSQISSSYRQLAESLQFSVQSK